jgi:hypothetical protein
MTLFQFQQFRLAMYNELTFPPPYKLKFIDESETEYHKFDTDVWYHGDWTTETLSADIFNRIEWLKIRPTYIVKQGKYVADKIIDEKQEFIDILQRLKIDFSEENGTFLILFTN